MKKVLIVKTSSLGDVIHTLPALTDAQSALGALGGVRFDWVVEENFAEIPAWHPAVDKVLPVAIRRWRRHILHTIFSGEWKKFKQQIQQEHYDCVIDAQGLLKSALISRLARGESYGLDKNSAREPLASRFYQFPQAIAKQQHAVERVRQLFAVSLGYQVNGLPLDYGIADHAAAHKTPHDSRDNNESRDKNETLTPAKQILFLHGTTWDTKHWPEPYWLELANQVTGSGYTILIPWGNAAEQQRAMQIKRECEREQQVFVLDKMSLNELVTCMVGVDAVVAVDTGLAHLSAALNKPTVALYGPTSPGLTGTYGGNQLHLQVNYDCAPCFRKQCNKEKDNINPACYTSLTPERVMNSLNELLSIDRQVEK